MASKPQTKKAQQRLHQALPQAETSYTVDPFSDLVSATELRVWRNQATTRKVLRYFERWRASVLEMLGEGASIHRTADETAISTVEYSAKVQLLKDILTFEAKDIADFYGLAEPDIQGEKK